MSGGRPAPLDGSLLARKGDAVPAIPDQSPLVFQLDEHRPELSSDSTEDSDRGLPFSGLGVRVKRWLRPEPGKDAQKSSYLRWIGIFAIVLLLGAVLWVSLGSEEPMLASIERSSDKVTVAIPKSDNLNLNLTRVPDPPQPPAPPEEPAFEPPVPKAETALPAAVALAASETSVEPAEPSGVAVNNIVPVAEKAPIFPINIPSAESVPEAGAIDPTPEVPPSLPKSVSPIPIPKAKPAVNAVPSGGRYAVQLASIAVEKRANQEAFRLQKQLGHILGDHEIAVEKAVIAGKGTTYRLRAGGFKTQAEANSACARVVQLKINCLALRR